MNVKAWSWLAAVARDSGLFQGEISIDTSLWFDYPTS